jgi:hypothetical protein
MRFTHYEKQGLYRAIRDMKPDRKKRRDIYLEAAGLVADSKYWINTDHSRLCNPLGDRRPDYMMYACHAIQAASSVLDGTVCDNFPEAFAFRSTDSPTDTDVWLTDYGDAECPCTPNSKEGNDLRQLVLLFAAAMCED